MKTKTMQLLAACAALLVASCATPSGDRATFTLPVAIGYKVPDTDVTVTVRPDPTAANGIKVSVSGTYKGLAQTATGWEFTSPKNPGMTYRIHTTGAGAPYLEIVGTGDIGGGVIVNPPEAKPVADGGGYIEPKSINGNPLDTPQP